MPDFGIFRGFNDKLFGNKLYAGQLPTQLGLIGSESVGFDPDAAAFFARVTTAGGSLSATERTAVETLVVQMKADGIWSKMKAIYPMVGASAAACAQNLKSSSYTGTFTSGWTFASTGIQGNGTSAYMDTGLNADTELAGNNSHLAAYSRTLNITGSDKYLIGAYSSPPGSFYAVDLYGSTGYLGALGSNTTYNTASVTNTQGFIGIKKETNNDQKSFRNSTILQTTTQTSTVKPNLNIWVAALNFNSAGYGYSDLELAFASIGDGLTDAQLSDYYTAVQAFQTTLSRQV